MNRRHFLRSVGMACAAAVLPEIPLLPESHGETPFPENVLTREILERVFGQLAFQHDGFVVSTWMGIDRSGWLSLHPVQAKMLEDLA